MVSIPVCMWCSAARYKACPGVLGSWVLRIVASVPALTLEVSVPGPGMLSGRDVGDSPHEYRHR